jgi:PD-(D/E)XK nuclease superfamily
MRQALSPITKIAHEVYRSLGSGFSEDVYDRAMQVGLRLAVRKRSSESCPVKNHGFVGSLKC